MSSKIHRHRSKPSGTTTQAFEENKSSVQEISHEYESSSSRNPGSSIDLDRLYERAFFTINGLTVEVILNNNILSWSTATDERFQEEKPMNKENMDSINLHKVYAVSPLYDRWSWLLNNNNDEQPTAAISNISSTDCKLRGFQLHSYDRMEENILQEFLVVFQSNLSDQIERWYQLLSKIIAEYKPSRNVLVICNPYSGSRYNRHVYNIKIKPMLERARYNITYLETNDHCSADEVLNDFHGDFNSLYGLVIIGGDGSVINVINALIRYLANENRTRLDVENDLPQIPFPICIVPNGTTNVICHSIHGNTDHCTPILHLIFNQQMKIDMSAVFDYNHNFVTANFGAGAGYPANALKYFSRYPTFKPKKTIQKSFAKAASNKNLKPIEMEIRYIPADQNNTRITRCYQGCPACTPADIEQTDDQVKLFDDAHIPKKGKRKKPLPSDDQPSSSSRKIVNQQNQVEKQWKTLRNNYLEVAILTNANLWSFAPQGISKYGHLADGLLDLILIEPTTRKDFLRYLKRNGNSKDQYEFTFTNLIKVKEIEIELKLPNDNYIDDINNQSVSDDSVDEEYSNNENKFSSKQKHEPHPPSVPISEDSRRHRRHHPQLNEQMDSPRIDSNPSFSRKNIFQSLKLKKDKVPLPRPTSAFDNEHTNEKSHRKNRPITGGSLRPARSFLSLLMGGNSSSRKQDPSSGTISNSNERRSSMISRSSSIENGKTVTSMNNQYRNKKQPCIWNLDFTPYNSPLIRIKCFYRFLPIFGVGLHPDTMISEVNYSCFGRMG